MRPHRGMRHSLTALAAITAVGLLLTGCGGSVTTMDEAMVEGAMVDGVVTEQMPSDQMPIEDAPMAEAGASREATTPVSPTVADRSIIRTAYISLRVDAVDTAVRQVRDLTRASQGLIVSENVSGTDGDAYASVTVQVPAGSLDPYLEQVQALGTVDSLDVSAQDVTTQVVDLDARIDALQTSIDRLTTLLAEADRVEDLLAVETELTRRQAELDSLTAQRTYLADQVAMSTVTVSLSPVTRVADVDTPGFLSGLSSGWSALIALVGYGFTALGFLLPFLLIAGVIAIPLTWLLVRQARRRRRVAEWDASGGSSPADAVSPSASGSSSAS